MADHSSPESAIFAVVVTYNPGHELSTHLAALRSQIADVLVVDNASANLADVRRAAAQTGCTLLENGANVGIAAALNQGARAAMQRGATWLATFDQDSLLPSGAIEALLACHRSQRDADRYAVIAPAHRDRGTASDYHHRIDILREGADWRLLRATITSGSLVRCKALADVCLFEERLFIDAVDLEFCLRVRRHGWLVGEARQVVMPHSIGASTVGHLFGVRLVTTHHSPFRRYYITRNMLEVCVRNTFFDPLWAGKGLLVMASGALQAVLREQQRFEKLRAVFRGIGDFALRRFGARY